MIPPEACGASVTWLLLRSRPTPSSMIESLTHERSLGQAVERGSHLFQGGPGGWVASQVALLFRICSQMEQFLADVTLSADVRPVLFLDCSQWRELLGHTPRISVERVGRDYLGERRRRGWWLDRCRRRGQLPEMC